MQRQRRFHRRTRNGCRQCKARHVRCDEAKPVCANCVRTGGTCVFSDPFISVSGYSSDGQGQQQLAESGQSPGESSSSSRTNSVSSTHGSGFVGASASSSGFTGGVPAGFTGGISSVPIQLPPDSRWLFDSMRYRIGRWLSGLTDMSGAVNYESFVIRTALSQPGLLHGALILEAVKRVWEGESVEDVRVPLLHHKIEAYRSVSQQIQSSETATSPGNVFVVAALTLLDAAFWECSVGVDDYALETHMGGLQRMLATLPTPQGGHRLTLFQRVIRMAMHGVQPGNGVRDLYCTMGNTHAALVTMTSFPGTGLEWAQGDSTRLATEEYAQQLGFNRVPADTPLFIRRSRSTFMLTYIHLVATIRNYMVTPFLLHWLIELFLHDLRRSEADMARGTWDRNIWFWAAMYGAAAAASAVPRNRQEEFEIDAWRSAFDAKIRLASSVLGLASWEGAVAVLQRINWEEFDGQEEMRAIWEEAVAEEPGVLA